jgi:hypothetical protein
MYRVRSEADVLRVAVAMNAGRSSLTEDSPFVAFSEEELEALGIARLDTRGTTLCELVNRWHLDADASPAQARELCRRAMQNGRPVRTLTKGMLRSPVEQATKNRCRAAVADREVCLDAECGHGRAASQHAAPEQQDPVDHAGSESATQKPLLEEGEEVRSQIQPQQKQPE